VCTMYGYLRCIPWLGIVFLLSGCATLGSQPPLSALGADAGKQRSIKDDLTPAVPTPAPKMPAKAAPPTPRAPRPAAGPKSPAESPGCASGRECTALLQALIEDPKRSWIGQFQPPAEYANGTRLFAYRALHGQLSCRELSLALSEIGWAEKVFRAPVAGVTTAQASRVLALNNEVAKELRAEVSRRCPA
jgi:hypothetical protein